MFKNVKYAIPGTAASFTLASGTVAYWCRDPFVACVLVMILAAIAGVSLGIVVSESA